MLKNKSIIFYIKRLTMQNIYCSNAEIRAMVDDLTPNEVKLYTTLKDMALSKASAEELRNKPLAAHLGITENAVSKLKVGLKKKGYAVINFSKDADGDLLAQVYLGKDQVALYQLGVKFEISDAKAYRKLLNRFPIDNPSLPQKERDELVKQANEYYLANQGEFR